MKLTQLFSILIEYFQNVDFKKCKEIEVWNKIVPVTLKFSTNRGLERLGPQIYFARFYVGLLAYDLLL